MKSARQLYLYLCVLLTLTTAMPAYAGTLSGSVTDTSASNPVSDAVVAVPSLRTATPTSDDGTYKLPDVPDGEYTVTVSRIGYAASSATVTVSGATTQDFELSPVRIVTGEVVTTVRGHATAVSDIPGSVEVLSSDEIAERNPVSIPEALSRKTGIAVMSDMPWSSQPVVRGLTHDHVVMLVDGARVSTNSTLPAQYGTVMPQDVERIEVLKGPFSVLYGTGSTGGVVNMITRRMDFTPDKRYTASIQPSYESAAGGFTTYERVGVSDSRFYLSASQGNRIYSDYRAADGERMTNSQFQDRQTQLSLGFKAAEGHIIEGRYQDFSALDVGIPGGEAFPLTSTARYPETTRLLIDGAWTWRPQRSIIEETKLSVYYQPIERRVKIEPNANVDLYPEADHTVHGARWQAIFKPGSHTLTTGIEGWQKRMESTRSQYVGGKLMKVDTPTPESTQRPIGVFAEDSFSAGTKTEMTIGARIDHIHTENDISYLTTLPESDTVLWDAYNDNDVSWSVTAGGIHHLSDMVDLHIAAARSFRSPTIEERYLYASLGDVLTIGNPKLDSEYGTFFEGGTTAILGSVRLEGSAYFNDITNMVVREPGNPGEEFNGQAVTYHYDNAGQARLCGIDARADWAPTARLLFSGDVSYVRGRDVEQNTDLPSMPPARGHLGIRWEPYGGLWVEPLITLVAKQNDAAPSEEKSDAYGLIDLSIGSSLFKTGTVTHNLTVGVRNVADKQYQDHLTVSRGYDVFGMGRSVFATWRITLGLQ